MKYYKNDIVEIINSKYKEIKDFQNDGSYGYYEQQDFPLPFIGQRFRIDTKQTNKYLCQYRDHQIIISIHKEKVILYKRPLINWVKWFLKL